jgi:hypothetical protein
MNLFLAFLHTQAGIAILVSVGSALVTSAGHWGYHIAMHNKRLDNLATLALIASDVVEAALRGAVIAPSRDKLITYAVAAAKDKLATKIPDIEKAFGDELEYLVHGAVVKEVGIGNVTVNLPSTRGEA